MFKHTGHIVYDDNDADMSFPKQLIRNFTEKISNEAQVKKHSKKWHKLNLEVNLPTMRTHEKQRREESKRRRGEKKQSNKKIKNKKMQAREKVGKPLWYVVLGGRKVDSLRWWVQNHMARWEMHNCALVWFEAHVKFKMLKSTKPGMFSGTAMSAKCTHVWLESDVGTIMYETHHCPIVMDILMSKNICTVFERNMYPNQEWHSDGVYAPYERRGHKKVAVTAVITSIVATITLHRFHYVTFGTTTGTVPHSSARRYKTLPAFHLTQHHAALRRIALHYATLRYTTLQ